MLRWTFDAINLPAYLLLVAILIQRGQFDTTHQSTLTTSAPIESRNTTEKFILTAEERHERLLKLRMRNLDNSTNLRYKPSNKAPKFGSKLTKPITNHVTKGISSCFPFNALNFRITCKFTAQKEVTSAGKFIRVLESHCKENKAGCKIQKESHSFERDRSTPAPV
jgi:hypothetical protein